MPFGGYFYFRLLLAEDEFLHSSTGPSSSQRSQRFLLRNHSSENRYNIFPSFWFFFQFEIVRQTVALKSAFNTSLSIIQDDFVSLVKESMN